MRWIAAAVLAGALGAPLSASANETITYSYDARGRLVTVQHSGTVNNGLTVQYSYDAAGNRTRVTTTGAARTAANVAKPAASGAAPAAAGR